MDLLNALLAGPSRFVGSGRNHEGETFRGVLRVLRLPGDHGVMLEYAATVEGKGLVHSESTLLGRSAQGDLCLWPVMSELPFVLPHAQSSTAIDEAHAVRSVFSSGPCDAVGEFREEITVAIHHDGKLTYSHAWGMPGGNFAERSSCEMAPHET